MTDSDIMPWGMHKGKKMEEVPDDYFLYLWENDKCSGQVKLYIKNNLDAIKANVNRKKK